MVERFVFFLGGGIFYELITFSLSGSVCIKEAEIFFLQCLKCFRKVAIFSGEGCRNLPGGLRNFRDGSWGRGRS